VHGYPHDVDSLAEAINQPLFPEVLQHFLWDQLNSGLSTFPQDIPLDECPRFQGCINIFHSAISCFYAPSNLCGTGGMYCERIQSNPNWCGEYAQYDTVFVETDVELPGMCGMLIRRVLLFFSFLSVARITHVCSYSGLFQLGMDQMTRPICGLYGLNSRVIVTAWQ
jgi:hypothetical protein